jgi:putative glutamine amidotransferase
VVPGRFSASASALRYRALVNAVALLEALRAAGGEPVTVLPTAPGGVVDADDVGRRLSFADAVLLPGGGDVAPVHYGATESHGEVYDVDEVQDLFDLAVARWALREGVPLLAVCRGLQVVNVAHGGTLEQHMEVPHRHVRHSVEVAEGSRLAATVGTSPAVSCYHHQRIDRLGNGLRPVARCSEGGVEAVESDRAPGFFLGVQWHPEDTAAEDPRQAALFGALVDSAR